MNQGVVKNIFLDKCHLNAKALCKNESRLHDNAGKGTMEYKCQYDRKSVRASSTNDQCDHYMTKVPLISVRKQNSSLLVVEKAFKIIGQDYQIIFNLSLIFALRNFTTEVTDRVRPGEVKKFCLLGSSCVRHSLEYVKLCFKPNESFILGKTDDARKPATR